MKTLTDDEVIDRAKKWARLHNNVRLRGRMDECLEGISKADQRRVYLCGQRIVGGLSIKVVPAATKGVDNGTKDLRRTTAKPNHATERGNQVA